MSIIDIVKKNREEFVEKYYDKNTPSGLNQKYPFLTFVRMVDDIRDTFLLSSQLSLLEALKEECENELEIQKKVQEKSKEIVAIGRARVAGMVAEKYTRIGKIEALSSLLSTLQSSIDEIKKLI